MAPSSSTEAATVVSPAHGELLLRIARTALEAAVGSGQAGAIGADTLPASLRARNGAFVTLRRDGELRGCIGALQGSDALARTVAAATRDAALRDPRFPAVDARELAALQIEVSVLSPLVAVTTGSRTELLAALEPGRDGLLLREGERQATFLPAVWQQLPQREAFLAHLLVKAGLPTHYWSESLRWFRYTAETFAEAVRH